MDTVETSIHGEWADTVETQIQEEVERHKNTGPDYTEEWPYFVGAKVVATQKIVEADINGAQRWTHAEFGDIGTIVFIERGEGKWVPTGCPTVRFHKTGTATTIFDVNEVSLHRDD
tara:strand:+ start:1185 stop:1532 length:348 start_codon:yes stop_codon:yes gene_type:complete